MNVAALMTPDPISVDPGTSVLDVRTLMHERHIHHVLVVEDDRLVGVVSDRDVLQAISPFLNTYTEQNRDVATLARCSSEIMSSHVITATEATTVQEAANLMLQHEVSCLPVVDEAQRVLGIVTSRDFLSFVGRNHSEEAGNAA